MKNQIYAYFDSNPIGTVLINPDTRKIVWMNKAGLQMIGTSLEMVKGQICHHFFCPNSENQCPVLDLKQIIDKSERIILNRTGQKIPVIKSVCQINIGKNNYICESFWDLNELITADVKQLIRQNQIKLGLFLDKLPCVTWTTDKNMRFTSVRGAPVPRSGFFPLEYLGKTVLEMGFSKQDPVYIAHLQALSGNDWTCEQLQGPVTFLLYLTQERSYNNEITGIIGVAVDITEQKKYEHELYEKQEQLDLILSQMPCVVWTTDKDLRYTSVSGAGIKYSGHQYGDFMGSTLGDIGHGFYSSNSNIHLANEKALIGEPSTVEQITESGGAFLCHVSPLFDYKKTIIGTVGCALNITEEIRAKEDIILKEKRIRELALAYAHAQDKEREWLTFEIHDRILQGSAACARILQSINKTDSKNAICENVKLGLDICQQTTNEIRSIMKAIYPVALKNYGLESLIRQELDSLKHNSHINTKFDSDNHLIPYEIQATLYRIFHEALINISKHAHAKSVLIKFSHHSGYVTMKIEDDGDGFNLNDIKDSSFGLTSMKQRAEILGGSFEIVSSPGHGTKITVVI